MSTELIQLAVLAIFIILTLSQAPIALSLAVGGFFGIVMLDGWMQAQSAVTSIAYSSSAKYGLVVIPMFILLGSLVGRSAIGTEIFSAANKLVGWLPGGLAASTVLATSAFSGVSGSSAADVATFGRVAVREMRAHGYRAPYAAAVVAAAGTFAVLIPPSIGLIMYAILAEVSVGAMLLAGIIPGIVSAVILILFIVFRAMRGGAGASAPKAEDLVGASVASSGGASAGSPSSASGSARGSSSPADAAAFAAPIQDRSFSGKVRYHLSGLKGLGYVAVLFIIVLGGIYTGVFTATEAAAVGAFAALILTIGLRRPLGESRFTALRMALKESVDVTSMIFLLLLGGGILGYFIVSSRVPARVTEWIGGLGVPTWVVLALLLLILLGLGTVLDGLSIMLITVPIMAPIVMSMGYDGIWFGVLVLKVIEVGLITPPVGINIFIVSSLVKDVKVEDSFKAVFPFVLLDLCITVIFFLVPQIILWLPGVAGLN